ncbi:MAG: acyl-CoA desaturase [Cyanobacteria bacterium J06598_3]
MPSLGFVFAIALWGIRGRVEPVSVALFICFFVLNQLGVEVGFHRLFAHSAYKAHPWVRAGLAILGSTAAQGPVINWAATHRRHHPSSDQSGDPHSPHRREEATLSGFKGFYHAHTGWMLTGEITNSALFTKDLLRDPVLTKINRWYFGWVALGLLVPTLISGGVGHSWLGALEGLLWGGLGRICVVHHVTWSSNSFCHLFGQRPFETGDNSTNNIWLAIPTIGIAWHNNHHAFPNSALHGLEWWQIDLGAWFIRALERVGLVWDLKIPTPRMKQSKRRQAHGG